MSMMTVWLFNMALAWILIILNFWFLYTNIKEQKHLNSLLNRTNALNDELQEAIQEVNTFQNDTNTPSSFPFGNENEQHIG